MSGLIGREKPPLRVDSTIQLAWGLTLNLSHEPNQVKLGQTFLEFRKQVMGGLDKPKQGEKEPSRDLRVTTELVEAVQTKKIGKGKQTVEEVLEQDSVTEEVDKSQVAVSYMYNLECLLVSYLRSMGFERDVFVKGLDVLDKKRDERIKGINELADMTSFSKDGAVLRIASFLGFGSLADFYVSGGFQNLSVNLKALFIGGFFGLVLVVALVKLARGRLISVVMTRAYEQEKVFWNESGKPVFKERLTEFFRDVQGLVKHYYPNYQEPILDEPRDLEALLDEILPHETVYSIKM